MEKYNLLRQSFEKALKEYKEKQELFSSEYESTKTYVLEHKKTYKELTLKAKECSDSRIKCNELWNTCLSHPLHYHFKGYLQPEVGRYGIK